MAKAYLDKLIDHYSKIAREQGGNAAHYAEGVRDALLAVRKIRDAQRHEQALLWRNRQGADEGGSIRTLHRMYRMFGNELDLIDDPGTIGTVDESKPTTV